MPALTIDQILSFEEHFEPAAETILKNAGLPVVSPFIEGEVQPDGSIRPRESLDDICTVSIDVGDIDPSILTHRLDAADGLVAEPSGYNLTLEVWMRVPMSVERPAPGEPPACYRALSRRRGLVRALFRESAHPFRDLCPHHDVLSLRLGAGERRANPQRFANEATETFRLLVVPRDSASL